jgi:oligosaccharyl transferase complex subunit OST4
MITDDGLYRLAIFLGSAAMLLIILYHFLEVNAVEESGSDSKPLKAASSQAEKSASSTR